MPFATVLVAIAVGLAVGRLEAPAFALAGLVVLGAALLLAVSGAPEAVLVVFLFSGSFKTVLPGFVDFTLLSAALTLVAMLVVVRRSGWRPVPLSVWGFAVLAVVLFVGTIGSAAPTYGLDKATRFTTFGLLVVLLALNLLRDEGLLRRFAAALAAAGTIMAGAALLGAVAGGQGVRLTALGSDTIALGRAAAIGFIAWLILALWRAVGWPVAAAGMAVCAVGLIGSGSRAPLSGLVLAVCLVIAVRALGSGGKRGRAVVGLLVLVAAAAVALSVAPQASLGRYAALLGGGPGENLGVRAGLYESAGAEFLDNPVVGVGTGGFAALGTGHPYPHNSVLELASENGLVGVVIWIALVGLAFVRALPRMVRAPGLWSDVVAAGLVLGFVNAMFSSDLNGHRMFYVFIVLALAGPVTEEIRTPVAPDHHPSS